MGTPFLIVSCVAMDTERILMLFQSMSMSFGIMGKRLLAKVKVFPQLWQKNVGVVYHLDIDFQIRFMIFIFFPVVCVNLQDRCVSLQQELSDLRPFSPLEPLLFDKLQKLSPRSSMSDD